jgi:hypothetical protein
VGERRELKVRKIERKKEGDIKWRQGKVTIPQ